MVKKIAVIKTGEGEITIFNHTSGLVSYATDGLENRFNVKFIDNIKPSLFNNFQRDYNQLVNGDYINKGQPLYRIINNSLVFLVVKTDRNEINRYQIHEVVFIRWNKLNTGLIKGRVIDKIIYDDGSYLVVELNRFVREWLNMRSVQIDFIKNIYRGIVIPRDAIFTQPEGEGVLVCTPEGDFIFRTVKVLDGTSKRVVVEGIEVGDKVVINPEVINYGWEVE